MPALSIHSPKPWDVPQATWAFFYKHPARYSCISCLQTPSPPNSQPDTTSTSKKPSRKQCRPFQGDEDHIHIPPSSPSLPSRGHLRGYVTSAKPLQRESWRLRCTSGSRKDLCPPKSAFEHRLQPEISPRELCSTTTYHPQGGAASSAVSGGTQGSEAWHRSSESSHTRKTGLNPGHTTWSCPLPPHQKSHTGKKNTKAIIILVLEKYKWEMLVFCFCYSLNFLQCGYVIRKSNFNNNFRHRGDPLPLKE